MKSPKSILFIYLLLSIIQYSPLTIFAQTYNDATLAKVRAQDASNRDASGKMQTLSVAEHALRGDVYASNRVFANAREHYGKILEIYPNDALVSKALLGIGRSYMWEKNYPLAVTFFDDLIKMNTGTKDGREGLAFKGASLVRIGKSVEAAKVYEQYTTMFPKGERIESSYLNIIDAYREAGRPMDALAWVQKTRQKFAGTPTETNAVFAQMRLQINQKNWSNAIQTADELRRLSFAKGAMTTNDEITFFKAYCLEKAGRTNEAVNFYFAVPENLSYYAGQATARLQNLVDDSRRSDLVARQQNARNAATRSATAFPAPHKADLLNYAKSRNVDARFVLAIMKQESGFNARAKSQSAARGLLQMTTDTADKYKALAGLPNLQAEQLYQPTIAIRISSVHLADLQRLFPSSLEAVAASYNGGEENAIRWIKRAGSNDLFAAEVGFAETKDYVFKVMSNYRAYRELYDENLNRK
ncbi:MAG: transglycosylase SLT domain-containing protein [Pyrinomonadaceae bacterium]|nr:transglycosylase SLT domain-containing protein [Pyrinomonadaceae bacterium]